MREGFSLSSAPGQEVLNMILEWNTEDAIAFARNEGREEGIEVGMEKGWEKGKIEGREEGWEKGRIEGRDASNKEIAHKALAEGVNLEIVQKITGLDIETVKNIQAKQV